MPINHRVHGEHGGKNRRIVRSAVPSHAEPSQQDGIIQNPIQLLQDGIAGLAFGKVGRTTVSVYNQGGLQGVRGCFVTFIVFPWGSNANSIQF